MGAIYWQSVSDFLAMGGYGFYVWMSFGGTALVIAIESLWLRIQARRVRREIDQ
jgi:heme exporter protein CcmD